MVEEQHKIDYKEHRAIVQLLRAHYDQFKGDLRGLIAFGDLINRGDTYDIDLLEVLDGWTGSRYFEFETTPDLPLRGKLRLYILTLSELTDPGTTLPIEDRPWAEELVRRVREGYEIIADIPRGTITEILDPTPPRSTQAPPASGIGQASDALHLLRG